MSGLVLDMAYLVGLLVGGPIWLYRMIRTGRYRRDLGQRFGAAPISYGLQPTIWVHGVSVGEILAARPLVEQLGSLLPDFRVVISSTTDTGIAAARRLFAADHVVFRWPLDFSLAVARALGRVRPSLVVLMEGEAWPNFLAACNQRGIPVVIVNGRMSPDKGYPGYKKLGRLAGKLFNRVDVIAVQDESYARRFCLLGTDPHRVRVTGMMKFDSVLIADRLDSQDALAEAIGLRDHQRLIVAGGTGPGEEDILLDVFARLRRRHADIRLALVPRQPDRFDEVARLITRNGLELVRRSQRPDGAGGDVSPEAVILGDTMGELRKFYALATCVFVGRSLVPMGGSDMIEAAALGKPTAFGPYTFNFPQADALACHGCVRVENAAGLERQWADWLADPAAAARAGKQAQSYVRSQQGATKRNAAILCELLGRVPPLAEGGIATDKIAEHT